MIRRRRRLCAILLVVLAALAAAGRGQTVEDGYIRLAPAPGAGVRIAWDPDGRGAYRPATCSLGPWGATGPGTIETAGHLLRAQGATYLNLDVATTGFAGPFDHGEDLPPGGNLGQSFIIGPGEGLPHRVWALLTGEGRPDSAATLTLRSGGPGGPVLARRRVAPLPENEQVAIELAEPLEPGTFYLELSEKQGAAYWWSARRDAFPKGTAFRNDKPVENHDRCFGVHLADRGTVDWSATPHGARLDVTLTVRRQERRGYRPALALTFPWQRDGYDTDQPGTTPFRQLVTDTGAFLPVEAFKRLGHDWSLDKQAASTRFYGTAGFDLKFSHAPPQLLTRMDADRIHFLLGDGGRVEVLAHTEKLPGYFPRFFTSDPAVDARLNRFLWTFLTDISSTPCTLGFDAIKLAWTSGPVHDQFLRILLHFTHRVDSDGYIWSRGESRGWDGSDCSGHDSRLFDTNAPYLMACDETYRWTGDRAFLDAALPTVRKATGYLLDTLHGRDGVLTIDSPDHTGLPESSAASSYFDCIPAGCRDAYVNAFFTPALEAAADLERAAGNKPRAAELETLAAHARRRFIEVFWSPDRGRFIGWVDAKGTRHDCGMTYVNTIAATHGLAGADQVDRMFRWMTDEPTASGRADTFTRWLFAPRSNTEHCREQRNRYAYDEWCEDGGAILWTAYYEINARARYLGADDAWRRFMQILDRYALPDHLIGGSPFYHGEINNHNERRGSVGVCGEFPESGLAPCAFLYAFVGVHAARDGLHLRPRVPRALARVGVDGLVYHGHRLKLTADRDRVVVEEPQHPAFAVEYGPDRDAVISLPLLQQGGPAMGDASKPTRTAADRP